MRTHSYLGNGTLHQHRPQTVLKHETAFSLALFTDKKWMSWKMLKVHATCITRGPRKGGLGAAQRYTKTPRGRALYKNPDSGRRKKNKQTIQIQKNRTKGENKRQSANARRSFKADKSTACKGDQTKREQRHSQAPYKNLDSGGQERTQNRQRCGQEPYKDQRADTKPTKAHRSGQRPTKSG